MRNRTMPDKWNRYAPCDNSKCEDNDGGKHCCIPNWYGCKERKCNFTGELEECTAISKYLANRPEAANKREVQAATTENSSAVGNAAREMRYLASRLLREWQDAVGSNPKFSRYGCMVRRYEKEFYELVREFDKEQLTAIGNAAKLREALINIQNLADALDLDDPNVLAILDTCRDALAAHALTKVKAYTALHRTRRDGPWYMSEFLYRDARQFDELRRLCAERCDREGDSYGAAMWRDDENIKIVPVEVELPDGIEIIDLDTTSSQPTQGSDK